MAVVLFYQHMAESWAAKMVARRQDLSASRLQDQRLRMITSPNAAK
jgi:hypothetical protein